MWNPLRKNLDSVRKSTQDFSFCLDFNSSSLTCFILVFRFVTLKSKLNVPFFGRPDYFPSPEKSFDLPVYAEDMAQASEVYGNTYSLSSTLNRVDPRILNFVDDEALESDKESVSD